MKWLRTLVLFDTGNIIHSPEWKFLHESYVRSIDSIKHPEGASTLRLRRKTRINNGQWVRNGVGYLRNHFLSHMQNVENWKIEGEVDFCRERQHANIIHYPSIKPYREPITSNFGGFDFVTSSENGTRAAIEWETGNISSSHRSVNKLAIALGNGIIQIGVLIVPSRDLYEHLTDRIGNIGELSGYLSMWESLKTSVEHGLLAITVVEHDELTDDVDFPYLPMGNDGRAREGRSKLLK